MLMNIKKMSEDKVRGEIKEIRGVFAGRKQR
jgi:hypothetical protein